MKKTFLSLLVAAVVFSGCSQKSADATSATSCDQPVDSIAQSVGILLAADNIYSNLTEYSSMIDEAMEDVVNGNVTKIHEAYAYVNALTIINKAFTELDANLDEDKILDAAHNLLSQINDTLDLTTVHSLENKSQYVIMNYISQKIANVHKEFLANVDKMEGITKSESGLRYILKAPGKAKIGASDKVKVDYTLYDYSKNVIDSSKGGKFEFQMPDGVVPGFAEAVQIAGYGGKINVWVPAELGYGDKGQGEILPGQVLVFEIEVLEK